MGRSELGGEIMDDANAEHPKRAHIWMLNAYILLYGAIGTFMGALASKAPEPFHRVAIGLLVVVGVAVVVRLIGRYTRGEAPWGDD